MVVEYRSEEVVVSTGCVGQQTRGAEIETDVEIVSAGSNARS